MVAYIYVDDMFFFGSTSPKSREEFIQLMKSLFEMNMVGELISFLGCQVKQLLQEKYAMAW